MKESCPGLDDGVDADNDGIPDCLQAIPAVSVWGLVVLTLLLMTAWKIHFGYPNLDSSAS